jgi:hypothetical protein
VSERNTSKKPQRNIKNSSASNLFLNIIIIILGAVIIYMAYSIFFKLQQRDEIEASVNEIPASIVQLEVLNGCGVSGVADKFTEFLRNNNFDVVQIGNYISFDIDNTLIIDRTGNRANAEKVAEALGVEKQNIIQQINSDYFLDVSLIIGKDFSKLKPNK